MTTPPTNYGQMYQLVEAQNKLLENNIQNLTEMYSTDSSQSVHLNNKYNALKDINYYLFLVYCGILIILIVLVYRTQKIRWYFKVLLVFGFALYPFVIYYIEDGVYQGVMNLYTL